MRVKIVKSRNPYTWYFDAIGNEYNVKLSNYSSEHYHLSNDPLHLIYIEDVEVVKQGAKMIEPKPEYVYAVVTTEGDRLTKFYDSISPAKAWITKKNTLRSWSNRDPLDAKPVEFMVVPVTEVLPI